MRDNAAIYPVAYRPVAYRPVAYRPATYWLVTWLVLGCDQFGEEPTTTTTTTATTTTATSTHGWTSMEWGTSSGDDGTSTGTTEETMSGGEGSCGNDSIEGDEVCDGLALAGQDCVTQGFDSGTLACLPDCSGLDASACGTCGNEVIDGDEACDDALLQGHDCVTLGFDGGTLECSADCLGFDVSGCAACGNGVIEGEETCDGADFGGVTCQSLGYVQGEPTCSSCQLSPAGCEPYPGMVEVPGGAFEMGSNAQMNEMPIRVVTVDTFWIDKHEVTVAEYEACVGAGACAVPWLNAPACNWGVAGHDDHPVNCLSWGDANGYCSWVDGGAKRLPTEAEWEKTARGTDARTFPWGDLPEPSCTHAVMREAWVEGCGLMRTWEVGSKPLGASPYGALDMAGNVSEYVADWYSAGYDPAQTDNPTGPPGGSNHVIRGGHWSGGLPEHFRSAGRIGIDSLHAGDHALGFRCAMTPPP